MITNSGWKAAAINPSTPVNFPASMTINSLTIRGASNTVNTLLLNYAGTAVPLTVLNGITLRDNARIVTFHSGLVAQGGTVTVTNAEIIQDGGFVRTLNAPVLLSSSQYHLTNGVFEGGVVSLDRMARFNQYGGTTTIQTLGFFATPSVNTTQTFTLYNGIANFPSGLRVNSDAGNIAEFYQFGGSNFVTQLSVQTGFNGPGASYTLTAGSLGSSNVSVLAGGNPATFTQTGGNHIITNTLELEGSIQALNPPNVKAATYVLNNGTLRAQAITLRTVGSFIQSNGITLVSGPLSLGGSEFIRGNLILAGGTLGVSNATFSGGGVDVLQTGGSFFVTNTLSFGGSPNQGGVRPTFRFLNVTLSASNIEVFATMLINSGPSGRINNPGFFRLGGTLIVGDINELLGRFILASNSVIDLGGNSSRLSFANSSGETWSPGATLVISNWNGSLTGGGAEQLRFGTDQSGLTATQLSQIRFRIGNDLVAARILNTGEVVPDQAGPPSGIVNSWINPASGNWDVPSNWSLGIRPNSSQSVFITNAGWKAVAINPSTPVNFPASMTVSNLTIRGAFDTFNTLLLNFAGTAVPLTVQNGLTVADNARIVNLNSGLVVQAGTFTVTNAQIVQDGGFIRTTNATMNLQNAVYQMTNGVFEGGQVVLGFLVAASFNQYGGSVLITNLVFGQGSPSAGGNYALYSGNLYLPGGLTLLGGNGASSSYFQAGGTNRTTSVFLEPNIFGISPTFTLNGGLLADNNVTLLADNFGSITLQHNGGTHIVSNLLSIAGGARSGATPQPATYQLNGGTLIASNILLNGSQGDAVFNQTNGITQAGQIQASSGGQFTFFTTRIGLSGGTLNAGSLSVSDGGSVVQSGGTLVVTNGFNLIGFRGDSFRVYTRYTLLGGTLMASNINVGGDFVIGEGSANRISNPGTFSLSNLLRIGNATEQLGRFLLVSNSIIDLAGTASRLSFANSSGQAWTPDATLVISNWNGSPSGGGAEQLRFGTNQSGLTAAQLSQIRFRIGGDLLSARILTTGEVVPEQLIPANVNLGFSMQGNNLILTWPEGWTLQSTTNVLGPYLDVPGPTSAYTNNVTLDPQRFFRLRSAQ